MRKHIKRGHLIFIFAISFVVAVTLSLWGPFSFSQASAPKYYGYYFVEDPAKNQAYINEVKGSINIINVRYDNGSNNSWDPTAASRIRNAGVKAMLQVPFGTDTDQTLFVNATARRAYLNKIKQDMVNTNFMSSLAYIAIYEEWYVLISQGYYDKWPIFQGKTKEQKFAIAKSYLEKIISDVKNTFPGIPTVIVENILPYPTPPSNVDVLGIDAYYIPDHEYCSSDQKTKFNQEVLLYFDAAVKYNKPMMMVAPSFVGGPWKMLSKCQMQWYSDLALSGKYNIQSFLWFIYANTSGFIGVRSYPDLVYHQKSIGCQMLGDPYCVVPAPTPLPPATYTVNLQANNGQYVVAELNGGGIINANRNNAYAWETFTMTDLNGGQLISGDSVGFSTDSGYYFRAEGGGGSTMDATARALGPWETFTVQNIQGYPTIVNGSQISIRTWNGINFVVAESGGGRWVAADRIAAWIWETFTLKIL